MLRLYFTPVTNKIGDDYFVCPKDEKAYERVIFKTDESGAFLLSLLQEDITCEEMAEQALLQFTQEAYEDILNKAVKIKNIISSLELVENTLEVIEI